MVPTPVEAHEIAQIAPEKLDVRRWQVKKVADHEYIVEGKGVERAVAMTNLENEEAVRRLQRKLERLGLNDALAAQGVEAGDTVRIGAIEFDYVGENGVE